MKQIQTALLEMDSLLSKGELITLSYAINEARSTLPYFLQMKEICLNVRDKTSMPSAGAVSRSLGRAVEHIFKYGDEAILVTYNRNWAHLRPRPNQFIRFVAIKLWDTETDGLLEERYDVHI